MPEMANGGPVNTGSDTCGPVRERLPLLHGPAAPPPEVAEHLALCAECAAEAAFIGRLREARPEPPSGLAARIVAHALLDHAEAVPGVTPLRPRGRRPVAESGWWTSSAAAAALLVLALGVGVVTRGVGSAPESGFLAFLEDSPDGWSGSEWFVAGAPFLEGVSDETLALLAAEMQP